MKKSLKILLIILLSLFVLSFQSCIKDENDEDLKTYFYGKTGESESEE